MRMALVLWLLLAHCQSFAHDFSHLDNSEPAACALCTAGNLLDGPAMETHSAGVAPPLAAECWPVADTQLIETPLTATSARAPPPRL